MKNKTIDTANLRALLGALENKRIAASNAARAAKDAKEIAESLGLESGESYTLKAKDDKSLCVVALWNERPVSAIEARVDRFFSYKQA